MSIEDVDTVDLVATRPGSDEVRLVLTDHLSWEDHDQHCQLLQEKINTYIAFVESGQLLRMKEPEIPSSPMIVILAVFKTRPTADASQFLERVRQFLQELGIRFEVEVRA